MTALDLDVIEALDFPVPCSHNKHDEYGQGDAKWLVRLGPFDHCTVSTYYSGLVCEGCMEFMLTTNKGVKCKCQTTRIRPYRDAIERAIPL